MALTYDEVTAIMKEANEAAQKGAQIWLDVARSKGPEYQVGQADLLTGEMIGEPIGYLLDLCGNAYLKFRDRRSLNFRAFNKIGQADREGIVNVNYKLQGRQEHGLHIAAHRAALEVFNKYGIGSELQLKEYQD